MNPNKKPFICSWQACKKEFINEDHLNVHRKKHKLALYLNSDCQSTADQTPTPTRFIRNCEELGLFQDLQNVNPFEETFRNATERVNSGLSLSSENNEETLHTPHIFSHIEEENEPVKKQNMSASIEKLSGPCVTKVLSCNNKLPSTSDRIVVNGNKGATGESEYSSDSSDSSVGRLRIVTNTNKKPDCDEKLKRERQREMNRVAQVRSRAKKKYVFERLLDEQSRLKREKKNLLMENKQLKHQVSLFKALFHYHKDCSVSKDPLIKEKVRNLIRTSEKKIKEESEIVRKSKSFKQILPNNEKYVTIPISPLHLNLNNLPTLDTRPLLHEGNSDTSQRSSETLNHTSSSNTTKSSSSLVNGPTLYTYGPPLIIQLPVTDSNMTYSGFHTSKRKAEKSTQSNTKILPKLVKVDNQDVVENSTISSK